MYNSIKIPTGYTEREDEDGFVIKEPTYLTGIPCTFLSATRNDEILANQKGYTADMVIETMACNYNGEKEVVDESTLEAYEVKRTFRDYKKGIIQLTCQRR